MSAALEINEKSPSSLSPTISTKGGGIYPIALPAVANADMFEDGTVDPVYQAKARILNDAFQEIGMGRYQVRP